MVKNPAAVALGSLTSPKKAASSRENGKKGGRPKKLTEPQRAMLAKAKAAHPQRAEYPVCSLSDYATVKALESRGLANYYRINSRAFWVWLTPRGLEYVQVGPAGERDR